MQNKSPINGKNVRPYEEALQISNEPKCEREKKSEEKVRGMGVPTL